jgi:hypothetical protein
MMDKVDTDCPVHGAGTPFDATETIARTVTEIPDPGFL